MKKLICVAVAVVLVFIVTSDMPTQAQEEGTIRVPDDFPTIRDAMNAASSGDTIIVADDIYTGNMNKNLDFNGKAITLKSENGPENCIIDCGGSGRGFRFHYSETSDSILDGFTIKNGDTNYYGGGIYLSHSDPTIKNCIVDNCDGGAFGGGIYCYNAEPTITNTIITGCTGTDSGGGIYCTSASPTIKNCTIKNNSTTTFNNGGGICLVNSNPTIENCYITGNSAKKSGGGIYCKSMSSPAVTNCLIADNTAEHTGGGVYCWQNSNATLTNCTITYNTVTNWYGGGIHCSLSNLTVRNTIIWGNSAGSTGHQIYTVTTSSSVTLNYCDYSNGTGDIDGNGTVTPDEHCITSDPLFVGGGDYHLQSTSPCIDAGDNTVVTWDYDWDGNARILDGDRNGTAVVDIGFYEAHPDWSPNAVVSDAPNLDFIAPVPAGFTDAGSFFAYSAVNNTLYYYEKTDTGWEEPVTVDDNIPNVIQIGVGDTNNDNLPDLYALAPADANLYCYENLGAALFAQDFVVYLCASDIDWMVPIDFCGDGFYDVLVHEKDMISLCRNSGELAETYTKEVLFMGDFYKGPMFSAAGDVDSNDMMDVVCAKPGAELFVLRQVDNGQEHVLKPHTIDYKLPVDLKAISVLDLDGNTYADVGMITESSPKMFTGYVNNGGLALLRKDYPLGAVNILKLMTVRLDPDAKCDFMALDRTGLRVSWWHNRFDFVPQPSDVELAYFENTIAPTYT